MMNRQNITHIEYRTVLALMLVLVAATAYGSEHLEAFLASNAIDADATTVLIMNLADGSILESHNIDTPLMPASTMKAVTTATLLNRVGKDYRYHTKVYADGTLDNDGVLHGNLVIVGSGDPSLNSAKDPKSASIVTEIVDALRKKNVSAIDGEILFDQSIFEGECQPASWESHNRSRSFGAGTFGVNFENNLSGGAPCANPSGILKSRLETALANAGIAVNKNRYEASKRRFVTEHVSPAVEEIMRSCMMRSDNMYAEALLRTYGVESLAGSSYPNATKGVRDYWSKQGAPMRGVNFADGSGLSREDKVTGRFMAYVLESMQDDVEYASFFPLAGQEGTLRSFVKGSHLDSYIALKTGTLRDVKCYAGYKLDDDFAPTHVVIIIMNNVKSSSAASAEAAKLLKGVFPD